MGSVARKVGEAAQGYREGMSPVLADIKRTTDPKTLLSGSHMGNARDITMHLDPAGAQMGLYGNSPHRQEIGKWDPLGQMFGIYGKEKYSYDPFGLKMGMYGYTVNPGQDMGQYVYTPTKRAATRQESTARRALPTEGVGSTEKLLLGM